jgi:hypothetical protein
MFMVAVRTIAVGNAGCGAFCVEQETAISAIKRSARETAKVGRKDLTIGTS